MVCNLTGKENSIS